MLVIITLGDHQQLQIPVTREVREQIEREVLFPAINESPDEDDLLPSLLPRMTAWVLANVQTDQEATGKILSICVAEGIPGWPQAAELIAGSLLNILWPEWSRMAEEMEKEPREVKPARAYLPRSEMYAFYRRKAIEMGRPADLLQSPSEFYKDLERRGYKQGKLGDGTRVFWDIRFSPNSHLP